MAYNIAQYRRPDELNRYLKAGILLSILIHLFFIIILSKRDFSTKIPSRVINVSFVPPTTKKKNEELLNKTINQIVSPSDTKSEQQEIRDDIKRFLSDQDNTVEKEQIKRGDAPDAGPVPGKVAPPSISNPAKAAQQSKMEAQPKKQVQPHKVEEAPQAHPLGNLRLDDKTLLEKFSSKNNKNEDEEKTNQRKAADYQAFSRPPGSGAAILGIRGSNDYLPNLPDGDITLLNTKATQYAVFVRRVATQVFGQMRRAGWESLNAGDIMRIDSYSTVHAVLDQKGNLVSVKIESSSGSSRFDEVLLSAVKAGARDPNPPEGAKAIDGLYHFIFKSQSWTRMAHNARSGAPVERRWLLLATGLE